MKKIILLSAISYLDTNPTQKNISNNSDEIEFINLNTRFWDWLSIPKNYYRSIDVVKFHKQNPKYISRIKEKVNQMNGALGVLRSISDKSISIDDIIGSYFIFQEIIECFNIHNSSINLSLDRDHVLKLWEISKQNLSLYLNSVFWLFFQDFLSHIHIWENTWDEYVFIYQMRYPSDFVQIALLYTYLRTYRWLKFTIRIHDDMYEFIDRKKVYSWIESHELRFFFLDIIPSKSLNTLMNSEYWELNDLIISIYGKQWWKFILFSPLCSYRCSFCNIGRNFGESKRGDADYESTVNQLIEKIKNKNISYLWIDDPNIEPSILRFFAKKVIQEWLEIRYHIRTRFSVDFLDAELASLLYDSWLRYMGIGLETASIRMNTLYRKYNTEYTLDDFTNVFDVLVWAWINIHIYTILGWPTETHEEIKETTTYLDILRERYKKIFFSYTPGWFSLLEWTILHIQHHQYGIKIFQNNFSFEKQFSEYHYDSNRKFVDTEINRLAYELFLPGTKYQHMAYNFFYFIENARILHIQKMTTAKNVYHTFFEQHKNIIVSDTEFFRKNKYLYIYPINKIKCIVHNAITGKEHIIPIFFLELLDRYQIDFPLIESLKKYPKYKSVFLYLIREYFLIKN